MDNGISVVEHYVELVRYLDKYTELDCVVQSGVITLDGHLNYTIEDIGENTIRFTLKDTTSDIEVYHEEYWFQVTRSIGVIVAELNNKLEAELDKLKERVIDGITKIMDSKYTRRDIVDNVSDYTSSWYVNESFGNSYINLILVSDKYVTIELIVDYQTNDIVYSSKKQIPILKFKPSMLIELVLNSFESDAEFYREYNLYE